MEIISLRKSIIKTLFNDITTKQEKPLSIDPGFYSVRSVGQANALERGIHRRKSKTLHGHHITVSSVSPLHSMRPCLSGHTEGLGGLETFHCFISVNLWLHLY